SISAERAATAGASARAAASIASGVRHGLSVDPALDIKPSRPQVYQPGPGRPEPPANGGWGGGAGAGAGVGGSGVAVLAAGVPTLARCGRTLFGRAGLVGTAPA